MSHDTVGALALDAQWQHRGRDFDGRHAGTKILGASVIHR